jgi:hypothetical protein
MEMRVLLRSFAVACALTAAAACSRETASEPPVATASLSLSRERAPIGSPLQITYKFQVAQGAAIDGDYSVFVHVIEPDGEKLWQDDHQPAIPTSQWKPGQTVEYTRTVFVPNYPYIGDANIRMGLYNASNGKRLPLGAQDLGRREYLVGKINLLPQSENIFLIFKGGWHSTEVDPNNVASEWQWTAGNATVSFRNPKRDATLYVEYDARVDLFTPPQQITLTLAGSQVGAFAADSRERQLKTFPVAAAQFGSGDMSELVLNVDRTFNPGGGDTRQLGIRVFHLFVEPK